MKRRLLFVLTAALLALLIFAGIVPNPFPAIWAWVIEERPIAANLAWQERLGARPAAAAAAGDAIVVAAGSSAQIYNRDSGRPVVLSPTDDFDADWTVVAGSGGDEVVITSPRGDSGYEVRDPNTGQVRHENDEAVAVWGFRGGWLDLRCDNRRACQLRSYRLGQREPVWRTDLPGQRSGMLGANPELAGPRSAESGPIEAGVSGPPTMPPLLGFPVTRRGSDLVVVVDTGSGRILQELAHNSDERVIVAGGRVVRSTMARHHGVCVSEVSGHDAVTGDLVWGPHPYHLWSTKDVGCEQRVPPLHGGAALTAVTAEGRPMVLDAYDGRVLWSGEVVERIESLSADRAVIRDEDGTTRYAVQLGQAGSRLWERRADPDASVVISQCGVLVADRDPNRLYVWDPLTGEDILSLATSARVLACAPDGILIADGRSIGFARFDGRGGAETTPEGPDPPADSK